MKKLLFFVFFAFIFLPVHAERLSFTPKELDQQGIDFHVLHIVGFSADNQTLIALEQVNNLELRAKGLGWLFRVFKFSPEGHLISITPILLPIWNFGFLAYSDDAKIGVVIAQFGTRILRADFTTRRVRTLFVHEAGKPGFRCQPIVFYHDGHFYSQGYFYDKDGYFLHNALVRLDLNHPFEPSLFQEVLHLDSLEKGIGTLRFAGIVSGTERFLGVEPKNSKTVTLYHYDHGKLTAMDTALAITGIAPTDHRIFYQAFREKNLREILIKDTLSNETWKLASGKFYLDLSLSRLGGKVAVAETLNTKKGVVSFFYAKESENFKLRPIPGLQNVPVGVFRLSPDGTHYAFLNGKGLTFATLP